MDFLNILIKCTDDVKTILSVVKWAVRLICIAIPIVLIVLVILDLAKVVTAGNIDDKMKKEVTQKVVTRVIYSVIIFLVPSLVNMFFGLLPDGVKNVQGNSYEANWWECYRHSDDDSYVPSSTGIQNTSVGSECRCSNGATGIFDYASNCTYNGNKCA